MALVTCGCGEVLKFPSSRAGEKIPCPKCGKPVDTSGAARVMKDTGRPQEAPRPLMKRDAPPPAEPVEVAPAPAAGREIFCDSCGFKIKPGFRACARCGTPLESGEERAERKGRDAARGLVAEAEELGKHALLWSLAGAFCFLPLHIVGLMKGFQSIKLSNANGVRHSGMAIGALCVSGGSIFLTLVGAILFFWLFNKAYEASDELFKGMTPPVGQPSRFPPGFTPPPDFEEMPSTTPVPPPPPPPPARRQLDARHRAVGTAFGRSVAARDYGSAYAQMAEEYKKSVSLDDFTKRLEPYRNRAKARPPYEVSAPEGDAPPAGRVVVSFKSSDGKWTCELDLVVEGGIPRIAAFTPKD